MKINSISKQALLTLCLTLASFHAMSQDYKIVKEVNNAFVDHKEAWATHKKYDYLLFPSSNLSVKQSGDKLTMNNKNDKHYAFEEPTNECREYNNGKISMLVKSLSDDPTKYCGMAIERGSDASTITSTFKKITNGPMDAYYRKFFFLVNGKGDVSISKETVKSGEGPDRSLFKSDAVKGFLTDEPNLIAIERMGLTWKFYLNSVVIFTYKDNSYGAFFGIDFVTDSNSKASFEKPSMIYYSNDFMPYERITTGTTTYKDNECRFKVMEGNIDKQCPSAEQNTEQIRYLSGTCYKEDASLQFGIMFFKKGEKTTNPLSEFLDTYAKELYGGNYDEAAFQSKKSTYIKEDEAAMVSQLKDNFVNRKKNASNIVYSELSDLIVGNNAGKYLDINFNETGVDQVRRLYYTYTTKGLMIIQFDAPAGGLDGNTVYAQIIKNIYTF